jgi:hypothetical protein
MVVHISVHFRGKIDVVPGFCCVKTEFVCINFFPVFPRRSFLFYTSEGEMDEHALPIPFSYRSMAAAYLKWLLYIALFFSIFIPLVMIDLVHPKDTTSYAIYTAAFVAAPTVGLLLLRWFSFASADRKAQLAEVPGLPKHIQDKLTRDALLYPEDDFFTKGRQDDF